jgi:hypothetical protein
MDVDYKSFEDVELGTWQSACVTFDEFKHLVNTAHVILAEWVITPKNENINPVVVEFAIDKPALGLMIAEWEHCRHDALKDFSLLPRFDDPFKLAEQHGDGTLEVTIGVGVDEREKMRYELILPSQFL